MSDLPHPAAHARTRHIGAIVVMALVAVLVLACSLLGQASGDAQARLAARSAAGILAIGVHPGDGAPSESPHHPIERKKPRQLELAVVSQADAKRSAPSSSAGIALIAGTVSPAVDTPSAGCMADTAYLPPAAADAGQLRLHPGQAPPSA